jgi:hypothetical protein
VGAMSSTASGDPAGTTTPAPPAPPAPRRFKSTLLKLLFSVVLLVVLFEGACQVMLWKMFRSWQAVRQDPRHCFAPSPDPILVYELQPNYDYTVDGRHLHINKHGLREGDDAIPAAPRKIAMLGDSVVFGVAHTQNETLSGFLQQDLDPTRQNVAVFNFGVSGYGLREVAAFLKDKNAIYNVNEVLYIMNPNDFSWRDTVYEGADNNLYRTYRRPVLASPLFVRKAIYRIKKRTPQNADALVSVPWYQWMYSGNRERGFEKLREIKQYCDEKQIKLTVMFLPAGCAYEDGKFALDSMYDDVLTFLQKQGVATIDSRPLFVGRVKELQDETDHLTLEGNRVMAAFLSERLK